ncbi:MAG: hypothetical protein FWG45_05460 [Oscillospiraceae bacterium]|nr:hypothetical protein [Oscillospiraceae bacterium]
MKNKMILTAVALITAAALFTACNETDEPTTTGTQTPTTAQPTTTATEDTIEEPTDTTDTDDTEDTDDDTHEGNIPPKKTQIDWLISAAGGDLEAAGGNPDNEADEVSFSFTSEDGKIKGRVVMDEGEIDIEGSDEAVEFAKQFTQHFATLARKGHFHDSHPLSARSTEEFPIKEGSSTFMTFCYASVEDGGMMSAIILNDVVMFVYDLESDDDHDHTHNEETCDDTEHDHDH